jgi:hypothetical protein
MDKREYEIQFVKPSNVLKKRFHSINVDSVIQSMIDHGFIILECQPIIRKEAKSDDVLLREMSSG